MVNTIKSFSNYVSINNQIKDIANVKQRLTKEQNQISSGYIADSYKELSDLGLVEGTIDNQNSTYIYSNLSKDNQYLMAKIDAMDMVMENIITELNEFLQNTTIKRSSSGIFVDMDLCAQRGLSNIQQNLNTKFQGKYMFSGSRINIPPVGDILNNSNLIQETITSNYYNGDSIISKSKISDNFILPYGITADNTVFQKSIAAFNIGKTATDDEDLSKAIDVANEAVEEIIALRSQLRYKRNIVANTTDGINSLKNYYYEQLAGTVAADEAKLAIEVQNDILVLSNVYQTYGKLSKLSLTNYL